MLRTDIGSLSGLDLQSSPAISGEGITVPDASLLFSGEYKRAGLDLVIADGERDFVVKDYFRGDMRSKLYAPDGASVSGSVVEAMVGPAQYAQAGGAAGNAEQIGRVVKIEGNATVIRNGVAVTLNMGDAVLKNDVVQTGGNSALGITFIDGTAFNLTSNARMVLNDMVYDPNGSNNSSFLTLVQGTITFVAGQTAKTGDMKIETPVATMGIRGTAVLVEIAANNGPTKFSVMVEPDGKVGSFNIYDKATGTLLGTVSQAGQVTLVTPQGLGVSPAVVQQTKTVAELQFEQAIVQQVFQVQSIGNQTPQNNPQQQQGDSTKSATNTSTTGSSDSTTTSTGQQVLDAINKAITTGQSTTVTTTTTPPATANDGNGTGAPATPTTTTVTVTPDEPTPAVNHAPVAVADTGTVQAAGYVDSHWGIGDPFHSGNVLSNDSDADGGTIKVVGVRAGDASGEASGHVNTVIHGKYGYLVLLENGGYLYTLNNLDADTLKLNEGEHATEVFTYTVEDATGLRSTTTLSIDVTGANSAPIIFGGTTSGSVTEDATSTTASGTLLKIDADGADDATNDGWTVVADDEGQTQVNATTVRGAYGTLTIAQDGKWTYTLDNGSSATQALTAGQTEQEHFSVRVADGHGAYDTRDVTVNVHGASDAVPEANDQDVTITPASPPTANIVIVLDVSGSMAGERLTLAKAALAELLASSDVNINKVMVVPFSDDADSILSWSSAETASAYIQSLTTRNGTDYLDAISAVMGNWDNPGRGQAEKTFVYFVSDGEASPGLNETQTAIWENFLLATDVDQSFAIGISTDASNAQLNNIAWVQGTNHDSSPIILSDASDLGATLQGTIIETHNIFTDGADLGADGGRIQSIEFNGVRYTWNGSNTIDTLQIGTTTNSYYSGTTVHAETADGAFTFEFADRAGGVHAGDWTFIPSESAADAEFGFDYTLRDSTGDTSSATVTINLEVNDAPVAVNDTVGAAEPGVMYFVDNEGIVASLWKIENGGEPELVRQLDIAGLPPPPMGPHAFNGEYYFAASTLNGPNPEGQQIFRLTAEGEVEQVTHINPANNGISFDSWLEFGGSLFFRTSGGAPGPGSFQGGVFRIDGEGNVTRVTDDSDVSTGIIRLDRSYVVGDKAYLLDSSDGAPGGTSLWSLSADGDFALVRANVEPVPSGAPGMSGVAVFDGALYYAAAMPPVPGNQIFRLDVDGLPPAQVTNVSGGIGVSDWVVTTDHLYFRNNSNPSESGVWSIDANGALIQITHDNVEGTISLVRSFVIDDELYILNGNGMPGVTSLWKIDGSSLVHLTDLSAPDTSPMAMFKEFNGEIYYWGSGSTGTQLYRVDTEGHTFAVTRFAPEFSAMASTNDWFEADGVVYFRAIGMAGPNDPANGIYRLTADHNVEQVSHDADGVLSFNNALLAGGDLGAGRVAEDGVLHVSADKGVLANDTDSDTDAGDLSAVLVTGPEHGTVTLHADGSYDYTPNADYAGADSFTYKVFDGEKYSNVASVALEVQSSPDAPTISSDTTSVSFTEGDQPILLAPSGEIGDVDNPATIEGATLTVSLDAVRSGDKLVFGAGSASFLNDYVYVGPQSIVASVSGYGTATLTITFNELATLTDVNAVLQSLAFASDTENPVGGGRTVTIAYNDGTRSSFTDSISVAVDVTPVNDVPVANYDGLGNPVSGDVFYLKDTMGPNVELWKLDADGNQSSVAQIPFDMSADSLVASSGDAMFFRGQGQSGPAQIVRVTTDGAVSSTNINGGVDQTTLIAFDGGVVFRSSNTGAALNGIYHLAEDGTLTQITRDNGPDGVLDLRNAMVVDDTLVFFDRDANSPMATNVWAYHGGGAAPELLTTLQFSVDPGIGFKPVAIGDAVYFQGTLNPSEIYRLNLDGDLDHTSFGVNVNITEWAAFNGELYFWADGNGPQQQAGLYHYGPSGDAAFVSANLYPVNMSVSEASAMGDHLLWFERDGMGNVTLRSLAAGAAPSTVGTYAIDLPMSGPDREATFAYDGAIYFAGRPSAGGAYQIYKIDGDSGELTSLTSFTSGGGMLEVEKWFEFDGHLYFKNRGEFGPGQQGGIFRIDGDAVERVSTESIDPHMFVGATVIGAGTGYTISEDHTLHISAANGVLANDVDPDDAIEDLTAAIVSGPAHGSLTLHSDGSFDYTPDANYVGNDNFTYQVFDGTDYSNTATVSLNVAAVNDAPVATPVTLAAIAEDSGARTITAAELLAGVSDVDGPTPTITAFSKASGNGTLTQVNATTWTYTPAANDDTSVRFNYTASDGSVTASSTASLDITPVNDTPVAAPVTLTAIGEDSGARIITAAEILAGVSDVEGTALTVTSFSKASGNGTLTQVDSTTWSYTPALNDDTAVTFDYTASDGSLSVSSTASLDIIPVDDAPVATWVTLNSIAEDSGARIITAAELLAGVSDVDGPAPSIAALYKASGGGNLTQVDAVTWSYTPALNDDTAVMFSYAVGLEIGVGLNVYSTAFLDITPVNDAPGFGVGTGKVSTDFAANDDLGASVTVQPDGKIVVAGAAAIGSKYEFGLVRYNADGTLDTSFNGTGKVTTAIGIIDDKAASVTLQPDGKIVVAGYSASYSNTFAVVRYNADGSLDASFNGGVAVTTAFGDSNAAGASVTLQPDGKIVVAGSALYGSNNGFALARYNADGSLDTSFNGTGTATTAVRGFYETVTSVALQPDGKIVVAGSTLDGSTYDSDIALVRYNANGTLDTSFGGTGIVTAALGNDDGVNSVTIQPDGKIVVAGFTTGANDYDFALLRYNADGSLDTSFGGTGKVTTALSSRSDLGYSVTLQDGKIVVAGVVSNNSDNDDFALVRYNADGSLDTSFGVAGKVTTAIGSGHDRAFSVAIQADGKIVVAGYANDASGTGDFAVARYNADGSPDTTFNITGSLDGAPTYTENGPPVVLDGDVPIHDVELSAAGNYSGATLTLARHGGASAEDVFGGTGALSVLTEGGSLVVSGTTVGTVTQNSGGTLVLTFNANATEALVNSAMHGITYANSSGTPPALAQIDWTFSDGNTVWQGTGGALAATGSTTVTIIAANNAPVAVNNTFSILEDTTLFPQSLGQTVVIDFAVTQANPTFDITTQYNHYGVKFSTSPGGVFYASLGDNGTGSAFYYGPGYTPSSVYAEFFNPVTGAAAVTNYVTFSTNDSSAGAFFIMKAYGINGEYLGEVGSNVTSSGDPNDDHSVSVVYQGIHRVELTGTGNVPFSIEGDDFTYAAVATVGGNVLSNDTDADNNSLTAQLVENAHYGNVTLNADGTFIYVPNPNYSGVDTFTYKANDGYADSNVATVTINVAAQNDAPAITSSISNDAFPRGTISFTDVDGGTHDATFAPVDDNYAGEFSLTDPRGDGSHVNETNGSGTVRWEFDLDNFTGTTVTQSYDVTVSDTAGGQASQRVSMTWGVNGASDTFHFQPGVGTDTIFNFEKDGSSHDLIELQSFAGINNVDDVFNLITQGTTGAVIQLNSRDSITVADVTADYLKTHVNDLVHVTGLT